MNNTTAIKAAKSSDSENLSIGTMKCALLTIIGIFVFFIPINITGYEGQMPFGVLVNGLVDFLGVSWLYFITIFMVLNASTAIYAKFITQKKNKLTAYFEKDTLVHIVVYILAAVYATLYTLQIGP